MADVIKLLPDSVANQIAAGEVIQRPASVIKELVENAADAGATFIQIVIKDAGRTLIQVTDNGCGMSPTDARLAFERHATSKIREAADLFTLHTMGFRGEALPSICAISQVDLRSATDDSLPGTRLLIDGSRVVSQEPCICQQGTTIIVKNLFFNVPARRRFLKTDTTELGMIVREFERLALVNTHIRFTLDTGNRMRDLRPGSFKQRILDIWKGNLTPEIIPVEVDTDIVRISGYITRPEHARRHNPLQFLIANGRNMKHPYFHRAITACYERLIASGTQPCYFIRFDVDPASLDVNIHPTKNEIKFENEQSIWKILSDAVKAALGKYSAVPGIDFEAGTLEVALPPQGQEIAIPTSAANPHYNPFSPEHQTSGHRTTEGRQSHSRHSANMKDWKTLYAEFMGESATGRQASIPTGQVRTDIPATIADEPAATSPSDLCVQLDNRYIVLPGRDGLMLIDQHRAHVKVLYEELMRKPRAGYQRTMQRVLFGEELHLDQRQISVLHSIEDELTAMGITLEQQDTGTYVITSLPQTVSGHDGREMVLSILDTCNSDADDFGAPRPGIDMLHHRIVLAMARSAAIHAGRALSPQEMENLVSRLMRLSSPAVGPDQRPILVTISNQRILSLFNP